MLESCARQEKNVQTRQNTHTSADNIKKKKHDDFIHIHETRESKQQKNRVYYGAKTHKKRRKLSVAYKHVKVRREEKKTEECVSRLDIGGKRSCS